MYTKLLQKDLTGRATKRNVAPVSSSGTNSTSPSLSVNLFAIWGSSCHTFDVYHIIVSFCWTNTRILAFLRPSNILNNSFIFFYFFYLLSDYFLFPEWYTMIYIAIAWNYFLFRNRDFFLASVGPSRGVTLCHMMISPLCHRASLLFASASCCPWVFVWNLHESSRCCSIFGIVRFTESYGIRFVLVLFAL